MDPEDKSCSEVVLYLVAHFEHPGVLSEALLFHQVSSGRFQPLFNEEKKVLTSRRVYLLIL